MRAWIAASLIPCMLFTGCKHRGGTGGGARPAEASASNVDAAQSAAAKQQMILLNLQTTEMQTDVPADVERAIPAFKDALVELADDVLAGQPATAGARQVEQALGARLPSGKAPDNAKAIAAAKAAGKSEFDVPEKGDYGGEVKVAVSDLLPGVLLVTETFGITCGEDNVLLGYSNVSGHWRRVLRWQAAPYQQVSGAFGDMFTPVLLKPRRNGHAVLLVVHGTPWCTSTESSFAMDTFEIDAENPTEKPFWHDEHSYRRADEQFHLKETSDGFEVRTSVDDRIGDSVSRTGIIRYAMVGNTMQRTLPIAMNSRESVSEWLDMSRDEAKLFTDGAAGSGAWQTWDALTFRNKSTDDAMKIPMLSYGDVRACTDAKHFQVEIRTEVYSADNKTHSPGPNHYVQVQETGNGYRIHDALTQPDPSCNGRVIKLRASGFESQPDAQ